MPVLRSVSPFFIVGDLSMAVDFYKEQLGFEVRVLAPVEAPFFAIIGRDTVQLFLKEISESVVPQPNHRRHEWAPWDAFVSTADPDGLAAEYSKCGVEFRSEISDTQDGLRGFEVSDRDGYVLFFGRPI